MTSIDNLSMQVDKFMFIDVIFFIFDDKFMTSIDNLSSSTSQTTKTRIIDIFCVLAEIESCFS